MGEEKLQSCRVTDPPEAAVGDPLAMLIVTMLSITMLSITMLSIPTLSITMLSITMLSIPTFGTT